MKYSSDQNKSTEANAINTGIGKTYSIGKNCIISDQAQIGNRVYVGHNCIIESNVEIGDGSYIDNNTTIRSGTKIGTHSNIGANCIIGEYWMDFWDGHKPHNHPLIIGSGALIRSGSIIYAGSEIGDHFQTGHQVTIREKAHIGSHVSIGTLSDIQGNCHIGNYVRLHSNVHVGQLSRIDDCVWIFPYVVLTNDPTPPTEDLIGVHIRSFAIVATGALLMPGVEVEGDSLIGAGAVITKNVPRYSVVVGNPGRAISDIRKIKNKVTGEPVYPWRYHFDRAMPWEGQKFDVWYNSLDLNEKAIYSLAPEMEVED